MKRFSISSLWVCILCLFLLAGGCSEDNTDVKVEVIDLNRVLDIMTRTMDQMKNEKVEGVPQAGQSFTPLTPAPGDEEKIGTFLGAFLDNLNNANPKLMSQPIAALLQPDGSIIGFTDENRNFTIDGPDKKLFVIQVDSKNNRLIATDTQNNYHRDHSYALAGAGAGLFGAYLLGNMLGRQQMAGIPPSQLSSLKMAPANYHSSAVESARAKMAASKAGSSGSSSGSARSSSSSGGFHSGK